MKRFLAFVILSSIFLSSLAWAGSIKTWQDNSGTKWDESNMLLIEKGKTTAKDIALGFGPPQKEIISKSGRIWAYSYTTVNNVSLFIPFRGPVSGVTDSESGSLTIWFNEKGIVTDVNYSYKKYENAALQQEVRDISAQEKEDEEKAKKAKEKGDVLNY